jgi:hypothetical protein
MFDNESSAIHFARDAAVRLRQQPPTRNNMFKIKVIYNTGDTFNTSRGQVGFLNYEFNTLDLAKAALKRMQEHYRWRLSTQTAYSDDLPAPEWFVLDPAQWSEPDYSFNVIGNDEQVVYLGSTMYMGYFESLEEASIVDTALDEIDCKFGSY